MSEFEQREQSIRLLDEHRDSLAAEERELVAKDPSAGSSPATASSEVGQLAAAHAVSWDRRANPKGNRGETARRVLVEVAP